jgi:hypothetical protein
MQIESSKSQNNYENHFGNKIYIAIHKFFKMNNLKLYDLIIIIKNF